MIEVDTESFFVIVPFFFVTSGIEFDLSALGSATAMLKLFMFFGLFPFVAMALRKSPATEAAPVPAT